MWGAQSRACTRPSPIDGLVSAVSDDGDGWRYAMRVAPGGAVEYGRAWARATAMCAIAAGATERGCSARALHPMCAEGSAAAELVLQWPMQVHWCDEPSCPGISCWCDGACCDAPCPLVAICASMPSCITHGRASLHPP